MWTGVRTDVWTGVQTGVRTDVRTVVWTGVQTGVQTAGWTGVGTGVWTAVKLWRGKYSRMSMRCSRGRGLLVRDTSLDKHVAASSWEYED